LVSRHPVYEACLASNAALGVADADWAEALPAALVDGALRGRILAAARDRLCARHGPAQMAAQLADTLRHAGVEPAAAQIITDP
jgi:hypothetical protein